LELVSNPTRSGQFAVKATVLATSGLGNVSAALVSRRGTIPQQAFFSAWFYVPISITETSYWLLFKFRSTSGTLATELWDLDIAPFTQATSALRIRLYSHQSGTDVAPLSEEKALVPIGRWFQTEALFRAANDASGKLSVWIDGRLVFELLDLATAPDTEVEWSIGAATETITPSSASLFFDDAAITNTRLGPDFPPFWRHHHSP
jgi:hypothetical protein